MEESLRESSIRIGKLEAEIRTLSRQLNEAQVALQRERQIYDAVRYQSENRAGVSNYNKQQLKNISGRITPFGEQQLKNISGRITPFGE